MQNLQKIVTSVSMLVGGLLIYLWWRRPPKQKLRWKEKQSGASNHVTKTPVIEQEAVKNNLPDVVSQGVDADFTETELDMIEDMIQVNQTELLESVDSPSSQNSNEKVQVMEEIQTAETTLNMCSEPYQNKHLNNSNNQVVRQADLSEFDTSKIAGSSVCEDKPSMLNEAFMTSVNVSSLDQLCNDRTTCNDISLSTSTIEPLLESTTLDAIKTAECDDKDTGVEQMTSSVVMSAENSTENIAETENDKETNKSKHNSTNSENCHDTNSERNGKSSDDIIMAKSAHNTSKSDKNCDNWSSRDSTPESKSNVISSDSNSSNCDSADSGKGSSSEGNKKNSKKQDSYQFNFPTAICGRLIGKHGKNINWIKDKTGANISLNNHPFTAEFQLCLVEGSKRQIDDALRIIERKFPEVDLTPVNIPSMSPESASPKPAITNGKPVLVPDVMQLNLPEGVSVDAVVSSIVDTGHVFLQQPTHPSFPSLERLNQFMIACYTQDGIVPQLPRPLEAGVICAAPMMQGWYRAQITTVYDDTDECEIKYVDYGGFSRVQGCVLRQIRSDFMTLPFQATECYMANITPLQDEEYFSAEAAAILEELTQGKLLQAQVVGRNEDGIPYIHIYQITGEKVTFVNRELVNRGVTRWIEILS